MLAAPTLKPEGTIRRITASGTLPRLLTYEEYATHPWTGCLPCSSSEYCPQVDGRRSEGVWIPHTLIRGVFELPRALIWSVLELYVSYSKTELRAAHPRRDPRDARRLAPRCGGRLVCRAVAPFRVVKMRRRSFTPRFASKTIRSLAHFHSAGDEGMPLVVIWWACRLLNATARICDLAS